MADKEKEANEPQPPAEPADPDLPPPDLDLLEAVASLVEVMKTMVASFTEVADVMREAASGAARVAAVELPSTVDLSLYRTVTAARGVQEANMLLAQGWDFISSEMCEEVLGRRGMGGQQSKIVWRPYYTLGKREPLAETDREAVAADAERGAWDAGMPVQAEADPEVAAAPAEGQAPAPVGTAVRGRQVTAASPRQSGHEGTGALANR